MTLELAVSKAAATIMGVSVIYVYNVVTFAYKKC